MQILEMTMSVAGNNSINRWKEGIGVPQSAEGRSFGARAEKPLPPDAAEYFKTFLTPTPEKYRLKPSTVAVPAKFARPALESRADVERALELAAKRKPRLPLVDEAKAREVIPELPKGDVPLWARLFANFTREGKSRATGLLTAETKGELSPMLKAQVCWIIARQDRAWYATGLARKRLKELGASDEAIFKLDGDWSEFTPAERAMFTVARKLAATPIALQDAEVEEALKRSSPREVLQLINYVTHRAHFNRVTEAAGLPVE